MKELQLQIFGPPAEHLSRRTDPETSKVAARKIVGSGRAATQRAAVARAVRRWPGKTSAELARLMSSPTVEVPRSVPGRRLCECERLGWVRRGSRRLCSAMGSSAGTYYPVDGADIPAPESEV